ncbi:LuxR C-terminal-related transcriptional regulator [Macrococcus animalis]|uniref:LuxR C-terminal-related transcriptional regulator n=1 Tax=Macrococcus animalis TaxID=3395467 RepID=UPI0039BDE988
MDDHELFGFGIKSILEKEKHISVEQVITDPNQLEACINKINPHIILCDIKIGVINGLDLIKKYHTLYSDINFIVLSGYNIESFRIRAFQNGASAYVLKEDTSEYLVNVINDVHRKVEHPYTNKKIYDLELTPKELDILDLISQDLTNTQISQKIYMSKRTVEYHISNIIQKLNVSSRLGAVLQGIRLGLIEESELHSTKED